MSRVFQKPTITKESGPGREGEVHDHPAYAMIGASRVQGRVVLFGSELQHHGYISVRISKAVKHRSLSTDWYHSKGEIIEVLLSEAQWATFVSAMNVGDGVPCTLSHLNRQSVPQISEPEETHHDVFAREVETKLAEVAKRLVSLANALPEGPLPKTKVADLAKSLTNIAGNLKSNTHFVAEQFQEHMENVTEKAKIEVNAFVTQAVTRAGLAAIAGKDPVVALMTPKKDGA